MQSVLRDIFNIPENACIYKEPPKTKYTEDDIKALEKEVFDLTQKYLTVSILSQLSLEVNFNVFQEKKIIAHAKKEKQILEQLKPTFQLTKMTLESLENDTNSTEPKKEKIQKFEEKLEEFEKLNCVKIDNSLSLEEDLGWNIILRLYYDKLSKQHIDSCYSKMSHKK